MNAFRPLLLLHQFVRGKQNRVVKGGARQLARLHLRPDNPTAAGIPAATAAALDLRTAVLGQFEVSSARSSLLLRGREILEQFGIVIEMNQERLIAVLAAEPSRQTAGSRPVLRRITIAGSSWYRPANPGLAEDRFRERNNECLRTPVFGQIEIVFRQIGNNLALFIAHGRQNIDDFYIRGKFRIRLVHFPSLCAMLARMRRPPRRPQGKTAGKCNLLHTLFKHTLCRKDARRAYGVHEHLFTSRTQPRGRYPASSTVPERGFSCRPGRLRMAFSHHLCELCGEPRRRCRPPPRSCRCR